MLKELVRKNRSYRRFDESFRITVGQVKQLLKLARLCPSAANLQQLRYYISVSPKTNALVFEHLSWAAYLRQWQGPKQGERPSAYIVVLGPADISKFLMIDTGIAAQTMLLGAVEMGLGGCQIASVNKIELHKALKLPPELEIILVLALGKPLEKVVIEKLADKDDIEYWKDESGVHHVPKRALQDLIIK